MNPWFNFYNVIPALWLLLMGYWIASAWGNKAAVYKVSPVWRILTILTVAGLVFVCNLESKLLNWKIVHQTAATELAGTALCAAGVALAIWARRTLATNWSMDPAIKAGHELIEDGPYRLARHPIYTGLLVALFGTELAGGQVKNVCVMLVALAILGFKIRAEESLMLRQFPKAYAEYRRRTKALIPYVI